MKVIVISPVFNEEEGINYFLDELENSLVEFSSSHIIDFRILLVNDGSTDATLKVISDRNLRKVPIEILSLSRNFGHQAAVWAGLESVDENSFVIVMDSDLQDPPSAIPEIVQAFLDSADVIFMQRKSREDGVWKKFFASKYYSIQGRLVGSNKYKNIGDFFGLSPRALRALLQHKESVKYIRGLISQLGFNQRFILFDRNSRKAGRTHYTISKMFSLAVAGVTGFSVKPLIWVVYLALAGFILSVLGSFYVLSLKFISDVELQPGWAFLSICILMLSSFVLIGIAFISLYLARITQEIKQRPLFIKIENKEA